MGSRSCWRAGCRFDRPRTGCARTGREGRRAARARSSAQWRPSSRRRSACRFECAAQRIAASSRFVIRVVRSWTGSALSSSPKHPTLALPTRSEAAARDDAPSTGASIIRELFEVAVLAVILYFGISFAVQTVHVEGLSMFATLDDNDYLIANKIDYRLHPPQRGDIIILRPPTNSSTDFIKRIVGLPGERVLIRSGVVYINGHKLDEPYLPEAWTVDANWPDNNSTGQVLGPDQYFVMGDNRNRSQDSRFFGPISRDRIDGKAWFRIWSLDHFGNIYQQTPTLETSTVFAGMAVRPIKT